MGVLGSLTELGGITQDVSVAPIDVPGEYSLMPRLRTVHGDKDLSGGSGVGWSDRNNFVAALSPYLEAIGLERAEPMRRMTRFKGSVLKVFKDASRPEDPKCEMSVRDCLRMLGVVITNTGDDISPAAPLAARIRERVFEVALPDSGTAEPTWMAYGEAVLKVMSGEYAPLNRSLSEDDRNRFLSFFAQGLRDIAAQGPFLVLAEQGGTTQFLRTLQNGNLEWDVFRSVWLAWRTNGAASTRPMAATRSCRFRCTNSNLSNAPSSANSMTEVLGVDGRLYGIG